MRYEFASFRQPEFRVMHVCPFKLDASRFLVHRTIVKAGFRGESPGRDQQHDRSRRSAIYLYLLTSRILKLRNTRNTRKGLVAGMSALGLRIMVAVYKQAGQPLDRFQAGHQPRPMVVGHLSCRLDQRT